MLCLDLPPPIFQINAKMNFEQLVSSGDGKMRNCVGCIRRNKREGGTVLNFHDAVMVCEGIYSSPLLIGVTPIVRNAVVKFSWSRSRSRLIFKNT